MGIPTHFFCPGDLRVGILRQSLRIASQLPSPKRRLFRIFFCGRPPVAAVRFVLPPRVCKKSGRFDSVRSWKTRPKLLPNCEKLCPNAPLMPQSFLQSLFRGELQEELVVPFRNVAAAERALLEGLIRGVTEVTASEAPFGDAVVGLLGRGVFHAGVPTEWGGQGLSQTALARIVEEVYRRRPALGFALAVHAGLAVSSVLRFGSRGQKQRWLAPSEGSHAKIGAFALVESLSGSDASSMECLATPVAAGYSLTGRKTWVSNLLIADYFVVFARLSPRQDDNKPKITCFLVPRDAAGLSLQPSSEPKVGLAENISGTLILADVVVPVDHVLGELGKGFRVAVTALSAGRPLLAGGAVGMAKNFCDLALERANSRHSFGRSIGEFGLVKDRIASALSTTYAIESVTYLTANLIDSGAVDESMESSACKVIVTEGLVSVAHDCLAIAASAGCRSGSAYEQLYRDARAHLYAEGTNETLRCYVALGGISAASKAAEDVTRAIREPLKGFGLLSEIALRKATRVLAPTRLTSISMMLRNEAAIFEAYAAELATGVDKVVRKHGRAVPEMQYTQKRLSTLCLELYALIAVLSRTTRMIDDRGEEGARRAIRYCQIFAADCERRLAQCVQAFDRNDDETRKSAAEKASVDGLYPFDVL
jgi:acyl-CoA dehydrogenase family member 9